MTRTVETQAATPLEALPLTTLPGVGPARASAFARLGIASVRDLLLHLPRRHDVAGTWCTVEEARSRVGQLVRVRGTVCKVQSFRRGPRRSSLRFSLVDETGEVTVALFNQPWRIPQAREWAARAEEVALEARATAREDGILLLNPRFEEGERELSPEGTQIAVYPTTGGLGQELLTRTVRIALKRHAGDLVEHLPADFSAEHELAELGAAVSSLHSGVGGSPERRRVALESLLVLQAGLLGSREIGADARALKVELESARERSPHVWTPGQSEAIETLLGDLAAERPMRRLLQGDVGSGKTLVAQCVADAAVRAGGQVALMAPTSTLAEQHFASLKPWFASRGIRVALVTGAVTGAERRETRAALAKGEIDVAIGTQALVSEGVEFARLALGIVDEEQRFGVAQQSRLYERGAHALVMTATPIPRSLALTLYGDWDTLRMDGFPPGRGVRRTRVVGPKERDRAERFVLSRLRQAERAFWIVPRIAGEESSVEEAEARLGASELADYGLEVVHGRLRVEERNERLDRFRDGRSRLLLATTVVEVGVDVPEATVLVVEGAERFGLAQLHQLRGRVGRGAKNATAIFLVKRSSARRIELLERSEDGFEIAEEDLKQRGMGELLGRRQSGWNASSLAEAVEDVALVEGARELLRREPAIRTMYASLGAKSGLTRP